MQLKKAVDTAIYSAVGTDTVSHGVARSAQDTGNLGYKMAMDGGITLSVEAARNTAAGGTDNTYGITYTGVEGLTVGIAQCEDNSAAATLDLTSMYATYTFDAVSIGYATSESDSETASADKDFSAYGISYAVSDNLSLSYNEIESEKSQEGTFVEQDMDSISISYTMGGMTIGIVDAEADNAAYTVGRTQSARSVSLSVAF